MAGLFTKTLIARLLCLAVMLGVEVAALSFFVDNEALARTGHLLPLLWQWGPVLVRGAIAFGAVFLTFALLKCRDALERIALPPIHPAWLAVHVLAAIGFAFATIRLYAGGQSDLNADLLVAAWAFLGMLTVALAAAGFLKFRTWLQVFAATGSLWVVALATALITSFFTQPARTLWEPTTRLTFTLVKFMLSWILPEAVMLPEQATIRAPHFSVIISPECSGLEGATLMLLFAIAWLWLFRQECRFPWALALPPLGVIALFLLNAVRLTALVLIGNAGAKQIAAGGFHSQAGWISFNAVAFGLCVVARRSPWFSVGVRSSFPEKTQEDATTAFLVPFLAILGTGMLARAASSGFESLYPLRFLVGVLALWIFRRSYGDCDWRFAWPALIAGAAVFVLWVVLDRIAGVSSASPIPAALASLSGPGRILWLGARVLAACITVPVAEELAFRGYLMRRLAAADFESVDPRRFTWVSLGFSSFVFGLLHGSSWPAGVAAGLVYGWLYARRGWIGDAVAAHATTNILLAISVLIFQQWRFW